MGKDTAAKICEKICQEHFINNGQQREVIIFPFAKSLKDVCAYLYGWAGVKIPYYYEVNPQEKETLIPALGMTVRDLWIKMGTYAIRDNVFKDTWVNFVTKADSPMGLLANFPQDSVILIPDLRFRNEMNAVREVGGICIRIHRDEIPCVDERVDNDLENAYFDCDIVNQTIKNTELILADVMKERVL